MHGRRAWRLGAVALVALLNAGCRLDAAVTVALEPDGSGVLEVALTADRALRTQAAAVGADPLGTLEQRLRDAEGWEVAGTQDRHGGRRTVLRAPFADPAAFERLTARFAAALAAPELEVLGPMRLERDGDVLRVGGTASLAPRPGMREHGLSQSEAVDALAEAVHYEVRVRLPGEVLDSNADTQDGGELRWIVPAGRTVDFHAEGSRPQSNLALLVGGGVLAAVLSALLLRRSQRSGR